MLGRGPPHQTDPLAALPARRSSTEISVDPRTTSRRRFLSLLATTPVAGAALAACGGSGPTQTGAGGGGGNTGGGGGGGGGGATYWFLTGQPQQAIREDVVKRFNASNSGGQISYTAFQNDAYKTKIKTAIGAGQSPTIIWGWGGGTLGEYVKSNQVEDLTPWFEQNPQQKERRVPSPLPAPPGVGEV